MKKLVNPLSTGGAPLFGTETFSEILTQEVWDAIEATYESLTPSAYHASVTTDNMVLSGGEITDVGGGLFDVAAGIAYFKSAGGIIARFPALTSVNPTVSTIYINLEAPVTEQKTFFDATPKDYAITHSAVVAITAATDYVTGFADTGGDTFFPTLQWLLDTMLAFKAPGLHSRRYNIPPWDMSSVSGGSTIDIIVPENSVESILNIVGISTAIRTDDDVTLFIRAIDHQGGGFVAAVEDTGGQFIIRLTAINGEYFDTTVYDDDVTDNRGHVLVTYFLP